jgi:hypothetical protein
VKFSMSEAWRDATAMMSGNREVLLIVAGLFFFLPSVVLALMMGDVQGVAGTDPETANEAMMETYRRGWWAIVLMTLASIIGSLALLALLRDHGRPTVGEAIRMAVVRLLPAIGTYLLVGIGGIIVTLLTFAVAGPLLGLEDTSSPQQVLAVASIAFLIMLYPAVRLSLATPAIAIDKLSNPLRVLARSWRLTQGQGLRLLIFYVLLAIAYFVIAIVIGMALMALTLATGPSVGQTINAIVSGMLSAAVSVVFVAVLAAAHRQLAGPSEAAISETFE